MKILVHGNAPWLPTGYGQQMAQLVPRLASLGHEVAISAFCGVQGARSNWEGFTVFPGGLEAYGNDVITGHAQVFGADLVLTLMDAWVLYPDIVSKLNVACWMPVDCTPLSVMDRKFLRESGVTPIAMSRSRPGRTGEGRVLAVLRPPRHRHLGLRTAGQDGVEGRARRAAGRVRDRHQHGQHRRGPQSLSRAVRGVRDVPQETP